MKKIQSDPTAKQKAIDRYNSIGLLCGGGVAPIKIWNSESGKYYGYEMREKREWQMRMLFEV